MLMTACILLNILLKNNLSFFLQEVIKEVRKQKETEKKMTDDY